MKTLYRIECKDTAKGAYRSGLADCAEIDSTDYRHPTPQNDGGLTYFWRRASDYTKYMFGFINTTQYLNWFHNAEGRAAMQEAGGVLRVYEVPEQYYCAGEYQAIAHIDHMQFVDEIDLVMLESTGSSQPRSSHNAETELKNHMEERVVKLMIPEKPVSNMVSADFSVLEDRVA